MVFDFGGGPPEWTAPVMGYLLNKLERGLSMQQAIDSLQSNRKYAGMSDAEIRDISQEAQTNYDAQQRLAAGGVDASLADAILYFGQQPTVVGVRVLITGTNAQGTLVEASATVNVSSDATVQQILAAAEQFAVEQARHIWRRGSDIITNPTAKIIQVITRGFTRPSMSM